MTRLPTEYFRHKSRFIEIAWNVFVSRYKLWVLRHWIGDTHVSEVKRNDWIAGQRKPEYNFKRVFFRLVFGAGALKLAVNIPSSVSSHCSEHMLFIMKREDGSSLRRTHPHITRSVKKRLVVIVASLHAHCHWQFSSPLIKLSGITHPTH